MGKMVCSKITHKRMNNNKYIKIHKKNYIHINMAINLLKSKNKDQYIKCSQYLTSL